MADGKNDLTILFRGPFDEEDIQALADALRKCERKRPDRNYAMVIDEKGNSSEAVLIKKIVDTFPSIGEPIEIRKVPRKELEEPDDKTRN